MASIRNIIKGSEYALTLFTADELAALEVADRGGKPCLHCLARDKFVVAKPEEVVRQLYLRKLVSHYGYSRDRIAVEKPVRFGAAVHEKAADIVIWDRDSPDTAYVIVECKRPRRRDGVGQLRSYCNAEGAPIGVWTNGGASAFFYREGPNRYRALPDIPRADQTLADMLAQPWTLADLERTNVLVTDRTTLRDVILDMEDLVLANAGVDAFGEVFKLIYAKLYDEQWGAGGPKRSLEFRVGGHTAAEFAEKVGRLFKKARGEWPGVFDDKDRINLSPDHLRVCGSVLERVKLFGSNLQVVDDAFEYLSVQARKGNKGQFFTPRHVIGMCVKMLNPKVDEYLIDPAAGSCGFTVHSIFHVWGGPVSREPARWQTEYARTHVYAMDFDRRAAKVARAVNLIVGDGRTNVYCANTLDPRGWPEDVRAGMKPRLRRFDDEGEDDWNRQAMRFFDFDVLLTNPPFAGGIREGRILSQFELAKKPRGWKDVMPRDVLFLERSLDFLKPGGRAAIILPQARLNKPTMEGMRGFLMGRARVLAVVGLHVNTFKPHTLNTKTGVLFLQTWDENPDSPTYNPRAEAYPVFFAVSERPGKDRSGRYVYQLGEDHAPALDANGQPLVEHDLGEIAEAFLEWGRANGLSFLRGDC